jgi:hypothetical protein
LCARRAAREEQATREQCSIEELFHWSVLLLRYGPAPAARTRCPGSGRRAPFSCSCCRSGPRTWRSQQSSRCSRR